MNTTDKFWLLFCILFSTVGIVCSIISYNLWNKNRQIKTKGVEKMGVVIAHHQKKQIPTTTALAVVVQFMDETNQPRVFYSTTYTTPVMFQIGETVKLWYLKEKPAEVLLEGKDEWLISMVLAGFGLIFSLIGLPALLKELFRMVF